MPIVTNSFEVLSFALGTDTLVVECSDDEFCDWVLLHLAKL